MAIHEEDEFATVQIDKSQEGTEQAVAEGVESSADNTLLLESMVLPVEERLLKKG